MRVTLTPEEEQFAENVGRERNRIQREAGLGDGRVINSLQADIQGALAEQAVAKGFKLPWDGAWDHVRWQNERHAGKDVGEYGVRSTEHGHGHLLLHPRDPDDVKFILVLEHRRPLYIIKGWCYAKEGKKPENWRDVGYERPCFFTPHNVLRPLTDLVGDLAKEEAPDERVFTGAYPSPTVRSSIDFETHLIGPGAIAPRPVCMSLARRVEGQVQVDLISNGDKDWEGAIEGVFDDALNGGIEVVGQNIAQFDLPVVVVHLPRLMTKVWALFVKGLVRDTKVREKFLALALHGYVDTYFLPDGSIKAASYSLETLVRRYLGEDRSADKGHGDARDDVWRLHYDTLDGVPAAKFPPEAVKYAKQDAVDTLLVCEAQDKRAFEAFTAKNTLGPDKKPFDVFGTEWLTVGAAFALQMMTLKGFGIQRKTLAEMKEVVQRALAPEHTHLLYESGLLSRPKPAGPYANGAKNPDGTLKMKAAVPTKRSNKKLTQLVVDAWTKNHACAEPNCQRVGQVCESHGLGPLKRTPPSKKFPDGQVSTDGEVIQDLAAFDKVLAQFEHYQSLQKITTLYIPTLEAAGDSIHPTFDELKKTGRTSSKKSKMFPSMNIQQVPRGVEIEWRNADGTPQLDEKGKQKITKVEPRHCFISRRPGWVLCSVDYSTIELVTLAQTCFKLFGHSRLKEVIDADGDLHSFLAAQIAKAFDADFARRCLGVSDLFAVYHIFLTLENGTVEEKAFFDKYRQLGKITGLAYPGGLGPKKFISYAKAQFKVHVKSLEDAKQLRQVWMETFPEVVEWLGPRGYLVSQMVDQGHTKGDDERFCYYSPLGMLRSNCFFTEAANGAALQTPAAEAGKIALFELTRATLDPSYGSCLYGCDMLAWVHDEGVLAIPDDEWKHERAMEASRIMLWAMKLICPDMKVKAKPSLMRFWRKDAKYKLGPDGRLMVYEPERVK